MPIYLLSPSTILVVEVFIKLKNMIDKKKIGKAAKKYAKEKEKICKKIAEKYKSATSIGNWVTVSPDAAFEDGIDWFLKNLWHPANEKPLLRNGKCLVVYNSGKVDIFKISFVYEMLSNYGKDGMGWKCWCYVSDLFPKEGGKQ